MITIKAITNTIKGIDEEGNATESIVVFPERPLTEEEKASVISSSCDGENYIYLT